MRSSYLLACLVVIWMPACARAIPNGTATADAADPDGAVTQPDAEGDAGGDARAVADAGDDAGPGDAATADARLDASAADAAADATAADAAVDASSTDAAGDAAPGDAPVDGGGCTSPFTGALVAVDLAGQPGNEASVTATSKAAGVTAGALARSAALTAITGTNSINASGWALGSARDGTRYYTLTLTPAAGCVLDVASVSIDTKTSTAGPTGAALATSIDGFAAATAFAPNSVATVSVAATGATGPLELRVYGFGATSTGGTLRIQSTLTVTGSIR